jgi:lipoate-protein ligase A
MEKQLLPGALFEHYKGKKYEVLGTAWDIIDSGPKSAEENMRFDASLLENAERYARPVLHFYAWIKDSATYGHFVNPSKFLKPHHGLELARRPTGGGIVFHMWDMAFSVLVPAECPEFSGNTLENYAFVNRAVLGAVKQFLGAASLSLTPDDFAPWDPNCSHFCMAKPTKYDLIWEGKKIAGAAQRKTRKGFLHQGTIALFNPDIEYLEKILLPGTQVREAMLAHTCPLLRSSAGQQEVKEAKHTLRSLLATHLSHSSLSS